MSGEELLAQYRQRIIEEMSYSELAGIPLLRDPEDSPRPVQIPLNRVYTRVQALQKEHNQGNGKQFESVGRSESESETPWKDILSALYRSGEDFYRQGKVYRELERPQPVEPQAALCDARRIVILGSPGSGKTTLLRYLAQQAAALADGPIPIVVSLQQYRFHLAGQQSVSLEDFALTQAARKDSELYTILKQVRQKLWLLDDLDAFSPFQYTLNCQLRDLPGEIAATTRPTDYDVKGLETFTHFELLPMCAEEVKDFVTTCFIALSEQCEVNWDWAEQQMLWIRDHLNRMPECDSFVHTPLLLSYLITLPDNKQAQELPQQQTTLYAYYIERLMDFISDASHTVSSGEEHSFLPGESAEQFPRQLALYSLFYFGVYWRIYYYERQELAQLTFAHVIQALHRYLNKQTGSIGNNQEQAARSIVTFWLQARILHTWNEDGEVYLTFRHTLFQEYATAQGIAALSRQNFQRAWQFLVPRLHHRAWQTPLLMFAQLLDRSQHIMLIEHLLEKISPYERSLHRDFRLAVRLLNKGESVPQPLSEKILQRLATLGSESGRRRQIIARITYIAGIVSLFCGGIPWFSLKETIVILILWSFVWTFSYIRPILPRIQGLLSLPQRLHLFVPQREPMIELFAQCDGSQALPYLLRALHDSEPEVRKTAADILGNLGDVEPVPVLLDMMHDQQETVRRTAALALGKIGAVPRLFQALQADQAEVRNAAAETLARLDVSQILPVLQLALKEGKDYVRQSAINVLQELDSEKIVPALISALQDSDKTVRLLAAETLGQIGECEDIYSRFQIIPQLIKTLEDSEPAIRWTAAHALGRTHDPDLIPFLLNALRKNKTYVARAIIDALLQLVTERSIPVLMNSLNDADPDVRKASVETLDKLGHAEIVPGLINALQDEAIPVRREAASALGRLGKKEALHSLIEGLNDDDWCVRWGCAEALGKIGNTDIIPQLVEMMRDAHGYVCRSAVEALGKIGGAEVVPHLISALKSEKHYVQQTAQQALKQIGEAQTVPYLIRMLKDEHEYVRKDAENALKRIGDAQTIPYLILALQDPEIYVRCTVAEALGRIGRAEAVTALVRLLKDNDAAVQSVAAEALGLIGADEAIVPLLSKLTDSNNKVRRTAAKALGKIGSNAAVPQLLTLLHDPNMNVRRTAVEALGRLAHPAAVLSLMNALHDSGWWIRWNAAYALGKIKDRRAVPILIQTLKDPDENVRRASAEALGHIGSSQAVNPLIGALSEKSWTVRWAAIHALGQIGDPSPFPWLIELLNDDNEKVRWAVAEALGKLGNPDAVPFLIHALIDHSWDVRKAAAKSLSQLSNARAIPYLLEAMRRNHDYVRRTTTQALQQTLNEQAIPYLIEALKDENDYIRKIAADNLAQLGHEHAIPDLIRILAHHHWSVRQVAADVMAELAPVARNRKLLKRAARALWWRLTDVEPVAKSAFHALEQTASRLVLLQDSALAHTSSFAFFEENK